MKKLVTGAAGFIGMSCSLRLLERGDVVVGIDNLNDYYDVELKNARLERLLSYPNFKFYKIDISNRISIENLFASEKPDRVIHLAAQAGVRHSVTNPHAFVDANLQGFVNVLEGCRNQKIDHLVYASSSSVYGGNTSFPFEENNNVDHPFSLYAATKKANELMAHSYSHLYGLPTTGLRFFTVYGPWGRPDMAIFRFANAMMKDEAIDVFNHGKMVRDFTYIDDIVEGVIRVLEKPATPNGNFVSSRPKPSISDAPYRIFNIGKGESNSLMEYIAALEKSLGVEAKKNFLPMQAGDVHKTISSTNELVKWVDFCPRTPVSIGVQKFADWYLSYFSEGGAIKNES